MPGVGGATPEELLDVPLTELVAGDESAGFFRPWLNRDPSPVVREGYSWGGLTSASRLRALWVLLAPFALANLAGWMLRHGGEASEVEPRVRAGGEAAAVGVVRLFGLALTVTSAGYVAVAAMDLVGLQCGASPGCLAGRWWLAPWNNQVVADDPGRLVVVGALVALAAMLAVAWLARHSQVTIHRRRDFGGSSDPALTVNFHHRRLWDSPHVAHRLGLTHAAAAMAAVSVTLAPGGWEAGGGAAVLLLGAIACLRLEGVAPRWHGGLLVLAALQFVLVAVGAWYEGPTVAAGRLAGVDRLATWMLPLYPLLALVAGVAAYRLWRRQRLTSLRSALVAPALLLVGAGMVHAFGSGLTIRLADLLGDPASGGAAGRGPGTTIVYSEGVADVAVITVFSLLVLGAVVAVVWWGAGAGPDCAELARRYSDRGGLDCTDPDDRAWAARVGRAESVARLTDRAALVLAVTTLVVLAAAALAVATGGERAGLGLGRWGDRLAPAASLVLGLLPVAAVVTVARLYRSRPGRRAVGILWDVATFWPRWFHPFAPPSYGEAAVPQLGRRLATLTERGRVVISAHSQGSVLAAATLAGGSEATGVALLTHGSPLNRLYARYFPEFVSAPFLSGVARRTEGWVNLWRSTDFIGGPLRAAGVTDLEVFDPPSSLPGEDGDRRPLPRRHSGYDRTADYEEALAGLVGALEG